MRARRTVVMIAAAISLTACGTAGSEPRIAASDTSTDRSANEVPVADDGATDGSTPSEVEPVEVEPVEVEPVEGEAAPDDATPSMVWPADGCSTDNSPSPTEAADAPAPVLEIRTESAAGPLPDLAVRRINCNGGWVNLRNELPSELPLLVWFWAPH